MSKRQQQAAQTITAASIMGASDQAGHQPGPANPPPPRAGFLALWNDCAAAGQAEYDLWHTREHVPQRLSLPGFVAATRYVNGQGSLPNYFTLYEAVAATTFSSEPYLALLAAPTPWSRDMRPHLANFRRHCCQQLGRAGHGRAAATATAVFSCASPDISALVAALVQHPAITATRTGVTDPALDSLHWRTADAASKPPQHVVILESHSRSALEASLAQHGDDWLARLGQSTTGWTTYDLAYTLTAAEVEALDAPLYPRPTDVVASAPA